MKRFWILMMVFITGCATTEKKAKNYYLNHKDELAKLCMDCFPPKVEYIKGKDIYLPQDTVFTKGETVYVQGDCPDGTKVSVGCPPKDTMKIYVPILRIDTVTRVDSAAIKYWQGEFIKADKAKNELILEKASEVESKKEWRKWALIFGLVIAVGIGWKIFSFARGFTILKK